MPIGSSIQRGYSRGGGQKPLKEGKKPPKKTKCSTTVPDTQSTSAEVNALQGRLDQLQAQYPELYGHVEEFAGRVDTGRKGKVSWMITFMENVIKREEGKQKEQQLIAALKKGWGQSAAP